ncbi:hypothetical protein SAMN04488061_3554 [Filomicrobium insigne]|uniref:Sulfotransferase family protein n=1 Tax=Filomicrobium insigne TaxID=418854 RepID=A0A1H0UAT8_9HYPH|nr:sulfotransferase [Filomicrobium insigne]SDP63293.1 hypothetical protein SAMN04488061_3554 [Filomicrobium insigne]
MSDLIDRGWNILQQFRFPDEKIFFIGFNKCGTTSLHHLLTRYAIRSAHWDHGRLATSIEALHHDKSALRRYLTRATAYSDIICSTKEQQIEGNRHFRLFHELFPQAYFIFNDRSVENWIRSRCTHHNGTHLARSMAAWNIDANGVKDIWRQTYEIHSIAVLSYFKEHPRFLHFRIDEDPIKLLIDFLSPSFVLREGGWHRLNVTNRP